MRFLRTSVLLLSLLSSTAAFVVVRPNLRPTARLMANLPDIDGMKAGELRKELESYGISTKAFLEKKEMVEAVQKARADGLKPKEKKAKKKTETKAEPVNGADEKEAVKEEASGADRTERIRAEMDAARRMKIGDLKKELENMGVSTKSFFEKSEFLKAYAEAKVDGVTKKKPTGKTRRATPEEPYDASYRDVVTQKMSGRDQQLLLTGMVIDITI